MAVPKRLSKRSRNYSSLHSLDESFPHRIETPRCNIGVERQASPWPATPLSDRYIFYPQGARMYRGQCVPTLLSPSILVIYFLSRHLSKDRSLPRRAFGPVGNFASESPSRIPLSSNDASAAGFRCRGRAATHLQLVENLMKVPFRCSDSNRKLLGDLLIGKAEIDQAKRLDLFQA